MELPDQLFSQDSYNPTRFTRLFAIEDRHFWFRTRNRIISTLVSQIIADFNPGYRVLEVGCGTGNVLRFLEGACPHGSVIGLDLFAQGLQYARRRVSCSLVQADLYNLPFGKKFELIGLFDVLEHFDDDWQVLHDLSLNLAPRGVLVLTVPAYSSLWSYHDEVAYHRRRYELTSLEKRLSYSGYQIEYITLYMMSIFPLIWLVRRLQRLIGQRLLRENRRHHIASNELRVLPVINELLILLLDWEIQAIACRRQLPIGTSLMAVARKAG